MRLSAALAGKAVVWTAGKARSIDRLFRIAVEVLVVRREVRRHASRDSSHDHYEDSARRHAI